MLSFRFRFYSNQKCIPFQACSVANENVTNDKRIDNIILKLLQMIDDKTLNLSTIHDIVNHVVELNLLSPDLNVNSSQYHNTISNYQLTQNSDVNALQINVNSEDDIDALSLFSEESSNLSDEQMDVNSETNEQFMSNVIASLELDEQTFQLSKDTGYGTNYMTPPTVEETFISPKNCIELENVSKTDCTLVKNQTPINTENLYEDEIYYSEVVLGNNNKNEDQRAYFSF